MSAKNNGAWPLVDSKSALAYTYTSGLPAFLAFWGRTTHQRMPAVNTCGVCNLQREEEKEEEETTTTLWWVGEM